METTAFFEKKVSLTPKDLNKIKTSNIEDIILEKAKKSIESKCSEQGFVLPGSVTLVSRSMGYFEAARFTGDAVYYAKLKGQIVYPADGVKVIGEVIRKNKMGLYVNYKDAIRIQVPRDLHLGNEDYEAVEIGDMVEVEIKRSKFQINDDYILASGLFVSNQSDKDEPNTSNTVEKGNSNTDRLNINENNTAEEEEFEEEEEQTQNEINNSQPQMGGEDEDNEDEDDDDEDDNDDDDDEDEDEDDDDNEVDE